jgi:predicted Rossmann fold nucleotide-binding protein DprA/Smf involved in DNA uptake
VCFSPGCESLIPKGAVPVADAADVLAFYGVKKVSVPLENDGAPLPKVLDPAACTLSEFAALNGAAEAEARPLYEMLISRARQTPAPRQPAAPPPPAVSPLELAAKKAKTAEEKNLSGDTRAVFLALEEAPTGLDDLAALTGLSPSQVMTAVTLLELEGLAETLPGDRVQLMIND